MTDTPANHEAAFTAWQQQVNQGRKLTMATIIVTAITALGWLLFFAKIAQTSDAYLRYSDAVHAQLTHWTIVLVLLTLVCIGLGMAAANARLRARKLRDDLISVLRNGLSAASEAGTRSSIESRLRELGA
ncbi:MAG TPA: hypothetical protein VF269_03605 [Rhodanobacteraceae bacterium]